MTGTKSKKGAPAGNEASFEKHLRTAGKGTKSAEKPRRQDSTRETLESIIVAFILAFLFRAFEAEAFVIPTGSMAPTLLGRHKDIECDQCKYVYQVGASYEVDDPGYLVDRMKTARCPNCRHVMPADVVENLPPYRGDRILVNKFPYEFADPQRWDVAVFKYPEDPQTSYIKRTVGLPGETIELIQGDVHRHVDGKREILRKDDPDKQKVLQILVYDNNFPEKKLHEAGWPLRWAAVKQSDSDSDAGVAGWVDDEAGWSADRAANSFQLTAQDGADDALRWIRYRNFVPRQQDWETVLADRTPETPQAQLITDFCGYNASTSAHGRGSSEQGLYWVGDLTVTFDVDLVEIAENAELLLELNEGDRKYRCRIDPTSGQATLFFVQPLYDKGEERVVAEGQTTLKSPGTYNVRFANVDDRLCLWIDDELVEFDKPTTYEPSPQWNPVLPQPEDLTPVGIAARGANVTVSNLFIERDIYYRGEYLDPGDQYESEPMAKYREYTGRPHELNKRVHDPRAWGEQYRKHRLADADYVDQEAYLFRLGPDEFFMMGDNSPSSKDSRLWSNSRGDKHRHAVPRSAVVGKAFLVYWPHGVPFLNDGQGYGVNVPGADRFRLFYHHEYQYDRGGRRVGVRTTDYPSFAVPFYPQIDRMKRIR
jgi:signal peptidase I